MNGRKAKAIRRQAEQTVGRLLRQCIEQGDRIAGNLPPPERVAKQIKQKLKRARQ